MEIADYIVHIVDDEEPVRKSLAFLLTVSGFAVRMHESATAFLAVAPTIRNGCLVTDLRMPDMSGVELLQKLRALPRKIPSIVITGHGDVPMAVEAMKAGAIDFIEKPFADEVLIEAIGRAAQELAKGAAEEDVVAINARLAQLSEREREVLSASSPGCRTRRLPTTSTSARAPSRCTAPTSWRRWRRRACRNWCAWRWPRVSARHKRFRF